MLLSADASDSKPELSLTVSDEVLRRRPQEKRIENSISTTFFPKQGLRIESKFSLADRVPQLFIIQHTGSVGC